MDNNTAVEVTVSLFESDEFKRLSKEIDKISNDLRHKIQELYDLHKHLIGNEYQLKDLESFLLTFQCLVAVEYDKIIYTEFYTSDVQDHILVVGANIPYTKQVLPLTTVVKVVSIVPNVGPQ